MKKQVLLLVILGLIFQLSFAQEKNLLPVIKSYRLLKTNGETAYITPGKAGTVFVFLSPECPLCKNYSPVLQTLQQQNPSVNFYGIIPGNTYSSKQITKFADDYQIRFPILTDKNMKLVKALQATVTPEAVVLDHAGQVYYRGLIDNWVTALGKKRARASEHYLSSAIGSLAAGATVKQTNTEPIGCLINEF
ncbi:redoxin domain-containing protein [uncultured Chitinophaga sp.]|uniref:redoxin domain-containing protein n=1 Tax=uncultured Chitinophaga sp. TaxID=339340 RepID=UPI0025EE5745|nr:redoxin domain-containing protein [uncultured Chitinophaga sp.]